MSSTMGNHEFFNMRNQETSYSKSEHSVSLQFGSRFYKYTLISFLALVWNVIIFGNKKPNLIYISFFSPYHSLICKKVIQLYIVPTFEDIFSKKIFCITRKSHWFYIYHDLSKCYFLVQLIRFFMAYQFRFV